MKFYLELTQTESHIYLYEKGTIQKVGSQTHQNNDCFKHPRLYIDLFEKAEDLFGSFLRPILQQEGIFKNLVSKRELLVNCNEDIKGGLGEVERRFIQEIFLRIGMNYVKVINETKLPKEEIKKEKWY